MGDKLIINCGTGEILEEIFTDDEIKQREAEVAVMAEQVLLNSLIPTEKEILMAEIEIQTIEILTEGGLL